MLKVLTRWSVRIFSVLMIVGIIGGGVVFYAVWYDGKDLPNYQTLADYEPPIVSRVYADNGRLIGEFRVLSQHRP